MDTMERQEILIVKTGAAVPEAARDGRDFEHWFAAGIGRGRFAWKTVRVDRGESLPAPDAPAAVVVTGSPAMVSERLDWSERTAGWLADAHAAGVPVLGVCYGHQLLAHALGGAVGQNPNGRRMGRVAVEVTAPDDPLLGPFAPATPFHVTHVEVVLEPPPDARVIGVAAHDPYHALHFGGRSWGVQFHPEFDARTMRTYIDVRAGTLAAEGHDPDALRAGVVGDDRGRDVLARFGTMVIDAGVAS